MKKKEKIEIDCFEKKERKKTRENGCKGVEKGKDFERKTKIRVKARERGRKRERELGKKILEKRRERE